MSRKPSKKLAKVVLATLLFTGGAQLAISPSVVEAAIASAPTISGTVVKDGGGSSDFSGSDPTDPVYSAGNKIYDFAHSSTSAPEGFKVTITRATGWHRFYGVQLNDVGTIKDNTLTVNGGNFSDGVFGGATIGSGSLVTKNTVIVNDGTMKNVYGGYFYNYGSADVIDNTVYINGGQVTNVYGGSTLSGSANDNKVYINGGQVDNVYGGKTQNGAANNNTVTVSGGTINKQVFGGNSAAGDANNNTVTISGGTIKNDITGGYSADQKADDNTVTISGSPEISSSVQIWGGNARTSASNNTVNILSSITVSLIQGGYVANADGQVTGNTLNIAAKGVTTGAVRGFQNMNFFLPSDIANNDTMLTVNDSSGTNVKDVTFGAAALSGVKLVKGDTVNLITNPNGLTMDDTLKTTDSATLAKETFLSANSLTTDNKYELSISKKGEDTIIATVDNVTEQKADEGGSGENGGSGKKAVSIPDVLKSPVETRAGVVTLVNAGADLLVSQGMSNAADAAAAERTEGDAAAAPKAGGFAPFAAVSFGKLRAESGSHVDNKGIGMNLGFAREIENKNGKLLIGPVIEYGHGSYDSYQDGGIKADGKSSYWGIGVIAKQTNDNGFYYEGSLRAGRTKSDYNSDLRPGLHVSYDSSATYWAAHLGVGKLVDIGHDNTLDYYGKYFYSHTGSDSTYLNGANETANFDAVNSHRIRLGARLTHALNEKNKIYGGLAWQYEFKGDARATYSVSGEAPSPSVKGSSGMIELGWQVKPGKSPMTIDLGVTGWVGKQRGITANLQANWTF